MGFRSVAHYLIQTRRSKTNVEKDEKDQSCNESLPFPDMSLQTESKESPKVNDMHIGSPLVENKESSKVHDDHVEELPLAVNEESPQVDEEQLVLPKSQSEDEKVSEHDSGKENEVDFDNSNIILKSSPKVKREPALATGPSPDSISLRLRQRKHNRSNIQSSKKREETMNVKQVASDSCSKSEFKMQLLVSVTPNPDGIAGRLRSRLKTV